LKQDTEKWQDRARMGIGLLGRVVIVIVSLTISAPFLSQIVFKQDIDNEMHRRNLASVSVARDSILAEKSGEIAALDSLILAREADLIQETAGRGTSGNYGIGPVTLTMEKNLQRLREERGQLVQERAQLENTLKSTSIEDLAGQERTLRLRRVVPDRYSARRPEQGTELAPGVRYFESPIADPIEPRFAIGLARTTLFSTRGPERPAWSKPDESGEVQATAAIGFLVWLALLGVALYMIFG